MNLHMKAGRIFSLALAATALLFNSCGAVKGREAADKAVALFHQQLDRGEFKPIYDATHSDFKGATSEKDFIALLDAVHRKLGLVQSSERDGWTVNAANFKVNVSLRYKTKFAEGDAFETFTYRVEGEKALLLGYNINSQTLITK